MKKTIFIALYMFFVLSACSPQQRITKNPPFAVEAASCNLFGSGSEEGRSGFILRIPIVISSNTSIEFKEVYFRGHVLIPELHENLEKNELICEYREQEVTAKPDMIMHADPKKEVGNQPPNLINIKDEKFPFELDKSEAVISYVTDSEKQEKTGPKYYKISDIKDKVSGMY